MKERRSFNEKKIEKNKKEKKKSEKSLKRKVGASRRRI